MTFQEKLTALVRDRAALTDSQIADRIEELRRDVRGLPAGSQALMHGYLSDLRTMLRTKSSETLTAAADVIAGDFDAAQPDVDEDRLMAELSDVLSALAAPGGWAAKRIAAKGKRSAGGQKQTARVGAETTPGQIGAEGSVGLSGPMLRERTDDAKRTKPCPHCGGSGRAPSGVVCPGCGGSGVVSVFGIALLDAVSGQTDPGNALEALQEIQKGAQR